MIAALSVISLFALGSFATKLYSWINDLLEQALLNHWPNLSDASVNGCLAGFWLILIILLLILSIFTGRKFISLTKIKRKLLN